MAGNNSAPDNNNNNSYALALDGAEPRLDLPRLRTIIRRRWRALAGCAVVLAVVAWFFVNTCVPQSFTSTTSLAIQHTSSVGSSLLAGLGLGPSQDNAYMGVLKSVRLARVVESQVHLQSIYHYRTEGEAIVLMLKSTTIQDSPLDGLLFVRVTLQGPPRLKPGAEPFREQVEQAAAAVANDLAAALRDWLATSDVSRDSVLLKTASRIRREALQSYQNAWWRYANALRTRSAGALAAMPSEADSTDVSPTGQADTSSMSGAAGGIQSLQREEELARAEVAESEASEQRETELVDRQLANVNALPDEDPLLREARAAADKARRALAHLRIQFADENPIVVQARDELASAQGFLAEQERSVRNGYTSHQLTADVKLAGLRARLAELESETSRHRKGYAKGMMQAVTLEFLREEWRRTADVLKETETQAVPLSLQLVAGKERVTVVDPAEPAGDGRPNRTMILALSVVLGIACCVVWVALEYIVVGRYGDGRAVVRPAAHGAASTTDGHA